MVFDVKTFLRMAAKFEGAVVQPVQAYFKTRGMSNDETLVYFAVHVNKVDTQGFSHPDIVLNVSDNSISCLANVHMDFDTQSRIGLTVDYQHERYLNSDEVTDVAKRIVDLIDGSKDIFVNELNNYHIHLDHRADETLLCNVYRVCGSSWDCLLVDDPLMQEIKQKLEYYL